MAITFNSGEQIFYILEILRTRVKSIFLEKVSEAINFPSAITLHFSEVLSPFNGLELIYVLCGFL